MSRDRDHTAALRKPVGNLDILECQQHKDEHGSQHEKTSEWPNRPIENAGDIIDRRADIGEDDRPAQHCAELT